MIDLAKLKKAVGLTMSLDDLRKIYDKLADFLSQSDTVEQQCMLLIMERMVLGDAGHACTLKFGHNSWNGEKCCICGVPVEQEGQAFVIISRWENQFIGLYLCEQDSKQTFEVDVDLLTGRFTSNIGLP
ncbi:MAG TPA: hypothetical protein VE863_12765 [Pyrinomonadaceae bacterium]|jgi:hypothetical protein|nr:hypothetical protein [Pyrinomonadaceae bacterium]